MVSVGSTIELMDQDFRRNEAEKYMLYNKPLLQRERVGNMRFRNKVIILAVVLILMLILGIARVKEVNISNLKSEVIKR